MQVLTKHRDQLDAWCIWSDGRPTALFIVKGDAPKFRDPQTYDVLCGEDYLFTCKSVSGAMHAIKTIVSEANS